MFALQLGNNEGDIIKRRQRAKNVRQYPCPDWFNIFVIEIFNPNTARYHLKSTHYGLNISMLYPIRAVHTNYKHNAIPIWKKCIIQLH